MVHPHTKTFESGMKMPRAKASVGSLYKAERGILMCPTCLSLYYKKSWHRNTDTLALREVKKLRVASMLCPADEMIKKGLYEGEVIIENVSTKNHDELLNLIYGFGKRAYERDCQDRIIEVKKQKNGFLVRTTENQLAQKLAKKVKDVFNKVELRIRRSKEPYQAMRIAVHFNEERANQ